MIAIDNVLMSDDVVSAQFVCDLMKCKGGCCEDGDAGAPLELTELDQLNENYEAFEPYLTEEGKKQIKKQGRYFYDRDFGWVTPTIDGGICVYGFRDEYGIIKCGIEQAYRDGKINFKKPISCHLYPLILSPGRDGDYDRMNYQPREKLCRPACLNGRKLQVPVYQFLKEPIIRKFGPEFYLALDAIAKKRMLSEDSKK